MQIGRIDFRDGNQRIMRRQSTQATLKRPLVQTQPDDFLKVLKAGTVSANVYLRRLQNFAIDLGWLLRVMFQKKRWPKVKHGEKRSIEEPERIIEREQNPERLAFCVVCWHPSLGFTEFFVLCVGNAIRTFLACPCCARSP
jgi:hypothetical protein